MREVVLTFIKDMCGMNPATIQKVRERRKDKMFKKSKRFYFVLELMFATSVFITICLIALNVMHYYKMF
jgi:hypothetical protein